MQSVMYLNAELIKQKTMLVTYKPYFQVHHHIAYTQQDLINLIVSNADKYSIGVLCTSQQQTKFKQYLINKQNSKTNGQLQNQQEQLEPNLLQEVAEESQHNLLQKANNMLQRMLKKTEKKIFQYDTNWSLSKIQDQMKKFEAMRQQHQSESQTGGKKAKKNVKIAEKKLQELRQRKKQLQQMLVQMQTKSPNKITGLKPEQQQQQQDSSLLCR